MISCFVYLDNPIHSFFKKRRTYAVKHAFVLWANHISYPHILSIVNLKFNLIIKRPHHKFYDTAFSISAAAV